MNSIARYDVVPLLYGDWVFWLPFPLVPVLCFFLSLLVLAWVAVRLHRECAYPLLRNVVVVCIPLWAGMLFVLSSRAWPTWTFCWFYGMVFAGVVVAFKARGALRYMAAVLLAAFLYHLGSVTMIFTLART